MCTHVQTVSCSALLFFFFQAEDGIRDVAVTGVQTCALPISLCPPVLRSTLWGAHPGEAQRARASGPARSIGRTLQVRFCRTLRFNLTTRPSPRRTGTVMSEPFRPYEKLVDIVIFGKKFQVPERNSLLRCFQFLSPETIPYGRFCWNQDCQYCRVTCQLPDDDEPREILSCKL